MAESRNDHPKNRSNAAVVTKDDAEHAANLHRTKLPVTSALTGRLEPGDRRFLALYWADVLLVDDGWTEYTLGNVAPQDLFGPSAAALLKAATTACGCGNPRLLIDFAQGIVYTGDEACVEEFLDDVVESRPCRLPLATPCGSSATGVPLDDTGHKAFNGNIIIHEEVDGDL